ncbi:MAG: DUF1330 domain-containing protein [Rhodospirillales bacterium]|nr:DUF1330 domain-containing protein [Rhodospirillales bacterium]
MSAYFIAKVSAVTDPDKLKEYGAGAGPNIQSHGGKTLAAAPPGLLNGESDAIRLVIVEFENMDALNSWYNSDDYKPLLELRRAATEGIDFALDGM